MTNGKEAENVVHKIRVDDNTELRIKIPVELDAMEFTSILEKSRKILRVSEVSVPLVERRIHKTTEQQDEVMQKYNDCSSIEERKALAEELGTTLGRLQARVSYYKMKSENPNSYGRKGYKERKKKVFPDSVVDKMRKMIKGGVRSSIIAKKLGLRKKQVYDKVSYMRKHGEL